MKAVRTRCHVYALGLIPFATARSIQEAFALQISLAERPPTLLLLEHPHIFTFGRRADADNLLWSPDELEAHGVTLHWTDRGGDVTYHGPGQLVGYPLLPLGSLYAEGRIPQADYVGYIRKLETMLVRSLDQLSVHAVLLPGLTGAWIPPDEEAHEGDRDSRNPSGHKKIASIGVKVDSHGISRHGFALNVAPDMSFWKGIVACGLADYEAVSIAELIQPSPSMSQVADVVKRAFADLFKYEMVDVHDDPLLGRLISENSGTTGTHTTAPAS